MNNEITFDERKKIQLKMLEEIDDFCRSHNIKYTIAYGTLIGAIRHKGFIPWDDDVDIMMPKSDLIKFKKEFKSNSLKFCDVETEINYDYPFPRISFEKTYQKVGKRLERYGVNIDLYYMIDLPDDDRQVDLFFEGANVLLNKRRLFQRLFYFLARKTSIIYFPWFADVMKNYHDYFFFASFSGQSHRYFSVSGLPTWKEVYNFDMFEELIDVQFENLTLKATSKYHQFLTQEYGDYMQLPPEEQRYPYHGGHYYWKSK